jgi:hypothetical protein
VRLKAFLVEADEILPPDAFHRRQRAAHFPAVRMRAVQRARKRIHRHRSRVVLILPDRADQVGSAGADLIIWKRRVTGNVGRKAEHGTEVV